MQPITITSFKTGLREDLKPFLPPEDSFTRFENAYVYRERVKKRNGLRILGRLRRVFEEYSFFLSGASPWTLNLDVVTGFVTAANNANPGQITTAYPHGLSNGDLVVLSNVGGATGYNDTTFTITVVDSTNFTVGVDAAAFGAYTLGGTWISNRSLNATEPNAEIQPGSVVITIGAIVFTDQGNGTLTSPTPGNSGYINYISGSVTLTHTAGIGVATTVSYNYFPSLPVMGISLREIASINAEESVFFDTKYAYRYTTAFEEFLPGTTWDGVDDDFFWSANYRGILPQTRLLFITNFNNTVGSPMRYTDGATWTTFAPVVSATQTLWQAAMLIPYYGRLLALNCIEGATASGVGGGSNIFNRCRFSALGDPTAVNAWRSDQFGQGGFIDAPTNEAIIGATFIKNTLIVEFERSHWELRYVGEYGLPFIWERVSADFGSESRFSGVTFDDATLCVGSTAIIAANANGVQRIDERIPDAVFNFRNAQDGTTRVIGVRDYQKELVYWCYVDSNFQERTTQVFPQKVLVYNYRLGAFSQFRQNVTFFGLFQKSESITWSSNNVYWDDTTITWDDVSSQSLFPNVVCGNQQGYIHYFNEQIPDDVSQTIQGIDRSVSPVVITSANHNYVTGDIIMFKGVLFVDTATGTPVANTFNDRFFRVNFIDLNTFSISEWDGDNYAINFAYTPPNGTGSYVGGGQIILFPKMLIETNDFNPWLMERKQVKLTRIDFLLDVNESANVTVIAAPSSSAIDAAGNIGNFQVETYDPYAGSVASEYLWHRFYLTMYGQFARIRITYSDQLMNTLSTHAEDFVLNAMTLWLRPGGLGVFR